MPVRSEFSTKERFGFTICETKVYRDKPATRKIYHKIVTDTNVRYNIVFNDIFSRGLIIDFEVIKNSN